MSSLTTRAKPKRTPAHAPQRWQQRQRRWNGLFVSFEGGEGAGKSSLIASVYEILKAEGFDVEQTREPGGTPLGDHIRQCLLSPPGDVQMGAKAELCLFLAGRAQHIEQTILPALQAGRIILCDRFNDSTIAYQGIGRGLGIDYVRQLCTLICDGVTPDLSFYLDVAPQIGLQRAVKGGKGRILDRIETEGLPFHESIRQAFMQIAQKEKARFHVVDAHQSQQEVFTQVLDLIRAHIAKHIP